MTVSSCSRCKGHITCCRVRRFTSISSNFSFSCFFSCVNRISYILCCCNAICSWTCYSTICTSSDSCCIYIVFYNTCIINGCCCKSTIFEVQPICQGNLFRCTIICFIRQVCLIRNLSTINRYLVVLSCTIRTCCRCYRNWIVGIRCICAYCYSCYSRLFNLCFRYFYSQIFTVCVGSYIFTIANDVECIVFKIDYASRCISIAREFQVNCISCRFSSIGYSFQLIFSSCTTSSSCTIPCCIG